MMHYTLILCASVAFTAMPGEATTRTTRAPATRAPPTKAPPSVEESAEGKPKIWAANAGKNAAGDFGMKLTVVQLPLNETEGKVNNPIKCETACQETEECQYWNFYLSKRARGRKCQLMQLVSKEKRKYYSAKVDNARRL